MTPLVKVLAGEAIKHVIGAVTNNANLKSPSSKAGYGTAAVASLPTLAQAAESGLVQLSPDPAIAWAQVALYALAVIQFCWKAGNK